MNRRLLGIAALVGILLVAGLYLVKTGSGTGVGGTLTEQSLRPDFVLPDLEGKPHSIAEWDGKILLINFWATWCPPCRDEIPDFLEVRDAYKDKGFEIVGVAIDDADSVRDFVDVLEIDYPILHGKGDAQAISQRYGNRSGALPYSVLIDREGHIRFSGAGRLPRASLEKAIDSLL